MSDPVLIAIVGGLVSLLLVFANSWAKRIEKQAGKVTQAAVAEGDLSDSLANDLNRATRSLGERLHDDTRALIRRGFSELNQRLDDVDRRASESERRRREEFLSLRTVMKPTLFSRQLDAIDQATEEDPT